MHQNTDWEKEFDELFCYRDSKDGRMKLHAMTAFADNYKDFIRSLLQAREEWLLESLRAVARTDESGDASDSLEELISEALINKK